MPFEEQKIQTEEKDRNTRLSRMARYAGRIVATAALGIMAYNLPPTSYAMQDVVTQVGHVLSPNTPNIREQILTYTDVDTTANQVKVGSLDPTSIDTNQSAMTQSPVAEAATR